MEKKWKIIGKMALLILLLSSLFYINLFANKIVKDYLFLLDTSGSMIGEANGTYILDKVKNAMYEKLDDITLDNAFQTNLVLMTFDHGVQSEWSITLNSNHDKNIVKDRIKRLKAEGDVTWITHGLDGALEKLKKLKSNNLDKTHRQYLYMFTDAINTGPGVPPKSFKSLINKHNLSPAEFHRHLYIIALGIPDSVTKNLKNNLTGSGAIVDTTIKGEEPVVPTTLYFTTKTKNYLKNKPIKLIVESNEIKIENLKTKKLPIKIKYPNGETETSYLTKKRNSFVKNFTKTNLLGTYHFKIIESYIDSFNICSGKQLEVNVNSLEVFWEDIGRISKGEKKKIKFTINAPSLKNPEKLNFSLFSKDPDILEITYQGKKTNRIPFKLIPNETNQGKHSFDITFHALKKIGWPSGVKFIGNIDNIYKFEGSVIGKISLFFWIVLVLVLLIILYGICLVLNNKVLEKWQITFENVTTSLSSYKNFFSISVVVGKNCFVDYFKSPCFKIYGNCLRTPFNKNIYIKAYKNININGEEINPSEKKEIYKETTINCENKTIVLKTDF